MLGRVPSQSIGKQGKAVSGKSVSNDEDTMVGALLVKKLDGETDEIVAIPGN